ncbi:hypothetical protein DFH06DRAFT_1470076 [Mycena polygramma]|nr:hypothetical protein DFH06DRAFT_1470076 [Mycena polygramma]
MSVEELRARITDISTQIAAQKELLKKLEKDKSLVQRELNDVLDPVARLPFDLSSDIFLRSLPYYPKPGVNRAPLLFLHVCTTWRNIALSTPALWQNMQIDLPCADSFKEGLLSWFPRAGNRLLSISLHGQFNDRGVGQRVGTAIWQHCPQLKHLELCDEAADHSDFGFTMMDLTRAVALGPLPCLETLTIRGGGDEGYAVQGNQILDLLRLAPNVVECTLDQCKTHVNDERTEPEQVASLVLRRLRFGASGKEPDSHDGILKYLSLPALEILSVAMRNVSGDDLISFLERSSPPLQELALTNIYNRLPLTDFVECLHLVPTLTFLKVWWSGSDATELFAVLADSPSLLPNLRRVSFCFSDDSLSDSSWRTLLRALSARRTGLKVVDVEVRFFPDIAKDIIAALGELVTDGMKIEIGTESEIVVLSA